MGDPAPLSTLWYYFFPGDGNVSGPVRSENPIGERQFRAYLRRYWELLPLPRGTQVWPTTQAEQDAMWENNRKINHGMPRPG